MTAAKPRNRWGSPDQFTAGSGQLISGAPGVRIAGTGSATPEKRLTNFDLEEILDTSDEWIQQRTGIRERRIVDQQTEGAFTLGRDALARALDDAGMTGRDLDLIIFGSVTSEMTCPSNACRVSAALDAAPAAAFDLVAACCGFVYSANLADSLIRSGRHRTIGIIGCDAMSTVMDYDDRSVSILFGDAAGAMVLTRDDDPGLGCMHQVMYADGCRWPALYMPRREQEVADGDEENPIRIGLLRMNGQEVYKFAVTRFQAVIKDALAATGLKKDDIAQIVCHQSNARMIESAIEKLKLDPDQVYINIDKYGNSSAGSVGLCLDELRKAGKVNAGDTIMLVAFGGGMTWSCSVWSV